MGKFGGGLLVLLFFGTNTFATPIPIGTDERFLDDPVALQCALCIDSLADELNDQNTCWNRRHTRRLGFERAAFLLRTPELGTRCQVWPINEDQCERTQKDETAGGTARYNGFVPRFALVGIIHTHPVYTMDDPSSGDRETADKWQIPNYVVSRNGIRSYHPFRTNERGLFKRDRRVETEISSKEWKALRKSKRGFSPSEICNQEGIELLPPQN